MSEANQRFEEGSQIYETICKDSIYYVMGFIILDMSRGYVTISFNSLEQQEFNTDGSAEDSFLLYGALDPVINVARKLITKDGKTGVTQRSLSECMSEVLDIMLDYADNLELDISQLEPEGEG